MACKVLDSTDKRNDLHERQLMERHDATRQCGVEARKRAVYPEATFRLREGEDSIGLYLDVCTDTEDAFAVLDLVSDWLVDFSVDAGVHLHVIPLPQDVSAPHVGM